MFVLTSRIDSSKMKNILIFCICKIKYIKKDKQKILFEIIEKNRDKHIFIYHY